jgi:hypothetical protein
MSDHLVHFMSGSTWEDAFATLCRIISERRLLGSGRINRGGHVCVCFSEAPLPVVPQGPVNTDAYSRYTPFGVLVDKRWLFSRGGRPVIYQSEREYAQLPETIQWRHVRYEPDAEPPVDFTWEREWRVQTDALPLTPNDAVIVLPNEGWEARLRAAFDTNQDWQVEAYVQILGRDIAEAYREEFPWRVTCMGAPDPATS